MEIFFYTIIFMIGAMFGSFYTLAVYRIPKRQDITHTHSYCPNCNHKLGFLELIPIFSYIFLGAKCKHCKEKIRPRYFILEITSGILFVLTAYFLGLNFNTLTPMNIGNYVFIVLYFTYLILIAGIDSEKRKIDKAVNIYGITISLLYMVYLYIVGETNIYRYVIYIILYILMLIFDTITLKRMAKSTYLNGILIMLITMVCFVGEIATGTSIIITLLSIAITILLYKLKNMKKRNRKTDKQVAGQISIGLYLAIANIITFLFAIGCNSIL